MKYRVLYNPCWFNLYWTDFLPFDALCPRKVLAYETLSGAKVPHKTSLLAVGAHSNPQIRTSFSIPGHCFEFALLHCSMWVIVIRGRLAIFNLE